MKASIHRHLVETARGLSVELAEGIAAAGPLALLFVPLLQWIAVLLVGLASLLVRPNSRGRRSALDA
jgi:hypothetical protein